MTTPTNDDKNSCLWVEEGSLHWHSSCDIDWPESSDCDPIQEWIKFCFNCGGKVTFMGLEHDDE